MGIDIPQVELDMTTITNPWRIHALHRKSKHLNYLKSELFSHHHIIHSMMFIRLQDCQLVPSESHGCGVQRDHKAMTGTERGGDQGGQAGRPGGAVTPAEPSPAELAQCQVEMGTLLTSIAELNRKIGKLKAPRCAGLSHVHYVS